ncbi:MAG TPA: pantoate--beta-alanine ligase [Sphingomicrobium sp.]|nr:pantoate--beta-alanine ligase [Sphingomicrobium sp.]
MQIVRSSEELARARAEMRGRLALVPTMGALHAGHMALVEAARAHADSIAATIFVNPAQFGEGEDFSRYPRREEQDAQMLEQAGCELLWMPRAEDIYPDGFATTVHVAAVSDRWEGEARPGHFDGVATIVAKLLLAVRPDVAVFGEKDFQQLAVIHRLVADLGLGVDIVAVPTVREDDGLALSSRNAYLSPEERSRAVNLYRALRNAGSSICAGQPVGAALEEARAALLGGGFSCVDYLALVDEATLEPINDLERPARLIGAAVIGTTRLIDNLPIMVEPR